MAVHELLVHEKAQHAYKKCLLHLEEDLTVKLLYSDGHFKRQTIELFRVLWDYLASMRFNYETYPTQVR